MSLASLSNDPFSELIDYVAKKIGAITGNVFEEKQHLMMQTRLRKRMMELKIADPKDYLFYIKSGQSKEIDLLIGVLTTHHTFFFREMVHFDFLETYLPQIIAQKKLTGNKTIKIWSAACSRGQEVYTLGMFLKHHLKKIDPSFDFNIFGSDIDPASVEVGRNGVYHMEEVKKIPSIYLKDNWLQGKGEISSFYKIKEDIRSKCSFDSVNLFELEKKVTEKFDVIFCRNVFIYFKPEQVKVLSEKMISMLEPWGLFITGTSESLASHRLNIKMLAPSTYCLQSQATLKVVPEVKLTPSRKIRVLAVDDSPLIHKLLDKMFSNDERIEIAYHAMNGEEAHDLLSRHHDEIDFLTLDIHMPVLDGVSYLKKYFNKNHPPVIMLTSVSREDTSMAHQALNSGALDYVEKPSIENLQHSKDEIKNKISTLFKNSDSAPAMSFSQEKPPETYSYNSSKQVFYFYGTHEMNWAHQMIESMKNIGEVTFVAQDRQTEEILLKHCENKSNVKVVRLAQLKAEQIKMHAVFVFDKTFKYIPSLCLSHKEDSVFFFEEGSPLTQSDYVQGNILQPTSLAYEVVKELKSF